MKLTVTVRPELETASPTSTSTVGDSLILAAILANGPQGPPGPAGSIGNTEFPDFTLNFENSLL